ncbi:hypothetical protein IM793_01075 [Pedobacter sp. MR2016-19]|uniref:hypothetical protein n=1 Tax=Pedobacter sp. MR2016-19 TaxID=2780089 RepID=UPI0018741721|nr:hypothetical protein [Pedobacter sp. MR2016-19]MBE5317736.1 hypothetical protein [Pedobacter sp. MR2016-19]
MEKKIKIRDLIVKQENSKSEFEKMAVPYCNSGYSAGASGGASCASGYSSNLWCVSNADSPEEVLF